MVGTLTYVSDKKKVLWLVFIIHSTSWGQWVVTRGSLSLWKTMSSYSGQGSHFQRNHIRCWYQCENVDYSFLFRFSCSVPETLSLKLNIDCNHLFGPPVSGYSDHYHHHLLLLCSSSFLRLISTFKARCIDRFIYLLILVEFLRFGIFLCQEIAFWLHDFTWTCSKKKD